MMRCAQRRFQPSPNTPRPSLENHRGGLDGLGVFLHFDSDIETKIPQNKNFGTGTPTNKKCDGIFVVVRVDVQAIDVQFLRRSLCDETVSYYSECPIQVWLYLFFMLQAAALQFCDKAFSCDEKREAPEA